MTRERLWNSDTSMNIFAHKNAIMKKGSLTLICLLWSMCFQAQDTLPMEYHGLTFGSHGTMKEYYLHHDVDTLDVKFFDFQSMVWGYQREFQRNKRWTLVAGLDGIQFIEKLRTIDSSAMRIGGQGIMASVKGRFYYLKRPKFHLFSSVGIQAAYYWMDRSRIPLMGGEEKDKIQASRTKLNFDLIGMRYNIGSKWAVQFVLSSGKVPMRFGINYRLSKTNKLYRSNQAKGDGLNSYTQKGSVQVSYSIGRMFEGSLLSSSGVGFNIWLEKFVKDQLSLGIYSHVSRGLYFIDDFSSLANGNGPGKLTNHSEYKESQVRNYQLSFRVTKYKSLGAKWNAYYGLGVGVRGRFLPNGQLTTSGSFVVPVAVNVFYGVQMRLNANCMLSATTGLIPNLLQLGLTCRIGAGH